MKKIVYAIVILITVLAGGFYALNSYIYNEKQGDESNQLGYKDVGYIIDGKEIKLTDQGITYFGNEAVGDFNSDGISDIAFIFTNQSGGSGTFYYAAAGLKTDSGYLGTNAIFLGDRIAPQATEWRDGNIIVNYFERKLGEPMTTSPSVSVSKYLIIEGGKLAEVARREITIKGRMVCLPHKNTEGPRTLECAFGLRDSAGNYYALLDTDPSYSNVGSAPFDVDVEVRGVFTPKEDNVYQSIGIIEVRSIKK